MVPELSPRAYPLHNKKSPEHLLAVPTTTTLRSQTTKMAQLLGLPQELLAMVANELQLGPRDGYKDLKSLSLVCRQLRSASQDALHRVIVIDMQKWEDSSSYLRSLSNLVCLARTLLERPDITRVVRFLEVDITKRRIGHKFGCMSGQGSPTYETCTYCWNDLLELYEKFTKHAVHCTGLALKDAHRAQAIHAGKQLAIMDIILACTPKLHSLTLHRWSGYRTFEFEDELIMEPHHINFHELFGGMGRNSTFCISWIPSLAKICTFNANCLLSPYFLCLPKVKDLSFALQDRQWDFHPEEVGLPDATNITLGLKRLKITSDVDSMAWDDRVPEGHIYKYTAKLPSHLPHLHHLDIVVEPSLRSLWQWPDFKSGDYQFLIDKFGSADIEVLSIYTSSLSYDEIEHYDEYRAED